MDCNHRFRQRPFAPKPFGRIVAAVVVIVALAALRAEAAPYTAFNGSFETPDIPRLNLQVLIDATVIYDPPGRVESFTWEAASAQFTATSASHLLTFGTDEPLRDATLFLDNIVVTQLPEPGAAAILWAFAVACVAARRGRI